MKPNFNPSDLVIKTKNQISEWLEDFEQARKQILASDDIRKANYNFKRFNLEEQEEITVVYFQEEIVAFSSLYYRSYYPNNVSRVLNRTWKSPKIRYFPQVYQTSIRCMLSAQLKKVFSLKKLAVFISVESKQRWLKKFTLQLRQEDERWIYCNQLYKVAPGEDLSCWQNVAFLPIKPGYKLNFPYKQEY